MTSGSVLAIVDSSLQGISIGLMSTTPSPEEWPLKPVPASLLWSESHLAMMGSAQAVSSLLKKGLHALNLVTADLGGVVVGRGPGTFTGIRIGLAFAAGLVAGLKEPVPSLGLSSLAAAVIRRRLVVHRASQSLGLLLPATKTHGYWAFCNAEGTLTYQALLDLEAPQWFEPIQTHVSQGTIQLESFGHWPLAEARLKERDYELITAPPSEVCRDAIYGMAVEAGKTWPNDFSLSPIEPQYLRLSTAEEKRNGKKT